MSTRYGYVRVSTKNQKIDRQIIALEPLEISAKNIYIDYFSGKDFKRPKYQKLLRKLKAEDELYITSIDRLGRNYEEIIEQWRFLTKDIGVYIIVLDMPLLDTRIRPGDLTSAFIADLVLQVLSYVAQIERDNTRQRQAEGIAAAQDKGKHCGRPHIQIPDNFHDIVKSYQQQEITAAAAARICNMGYATFFRKLKAIYNGSDFTKK